MMIRIQEGVEPSRVIAEWGKKVLTTYVSCSVQDFKATSSRQLQL